jgi:hypothetical protein
MLFLPLGQLLRLLLHVLLPRIDQVEVLRRLDLRSPSALIMAFSRGGQHTLTMVSAELCQT